MSTTISIDITAYEDPIKPRSRPRALTDDDREALRRLWSAGVYASFSEAAREFGTDPVTVRKTVSS